MNIDANDLISVLRQQVANAMNEAALNAALAMGYQKRITELEGQVVNTTKEKEHALVE